MSALTTSTSGGFRACRKIGGGAAQQKMFQVSASTNQAFFIGDAVALNSTGKISPYATTKTLVGVITSLFTNSGNNTPGRPLTFSQPNAGPYPTSGTAGWAMVNVDDKQTYVAVIGANVTQASFGGVAKVSAGTPNTRSGISGQSLAATISTSADADAGFQIIGFAPIEQLSTQTSAAAPVLVEVKLATGGVFGGNPV